MAIWSHAFSRAWRRWRVFALSSHWFVLLFTFVVIGHCNCFGFGFTTLNWKPFYLLLDTKTFITKRFLWYWRLEDGLVFERIYCVRYLLVWWLQFVFFFLKMQVTATRILLNYNILQDDTVYDLIQLISFIRHCCIILQVVQRTNWVCGFRPEVVQQHDVS